TSGALSPPSPGGSGSRSSSRRARYRGRAWFRSSLAGGGPRRLDGGKTRGPPPGSLGRRGLRVSDAQPLLDARVVLLADPLPRHQVLRRAEAARLLAVLDDPGRQLRPDSGQRRELVDGGGVDVDLRGRVRLARCAGEAGNGEDGDRDGENG